MTSFLIKHSNAEAQTSISRNAHGCLRCPRCLCRGLLRRPGPPPPPDPGLRAWRVRMMPLVCMGAARRAAQPAVGACAPAAGGQQGCCRTAAKAAAAAGRRACLSAISLAAAARDADPCFDAGDAACKKGAIKWPAGEGDGVHAHRFRTERAGERVEGAAMALGMRGNTSGWASVRRRVCSRVMLTGGWRPIAQEPRGASIRPPRAGWSRRRWWGGDRRRGGKGRGTVSQCCLAS